jgi:hypothetical protein
MAAKDKKPHRKTPLTPKEREEALKRWRGLMSEIDQELRDKGLTEAEREALIADIMSEGKEQ